MRAERRQRATSGAPTRRTSTAVSRFIRGDYAPVVVLALLMIALGAYICVQNDRYLSAFNTTSVMLLCTALGFIAIGQTIAVLLGGIDLSVGPLVGTARGRRLVLHQRRPSRAGDDLRPGV